jgi:hypothetical protein
MRADRLPPPEEVPHGDVTPLRPTGPTSAGGWYTWDLWSHTQRGPKRGEGDPVPPPRLSALSTTTRDHRCQGCHTSPSPLPKPRRDGARGLCRCGTPGAVWHPSAAFRVTAHDRRVVTTTSPTRWPAPRCLLASPATTPRWPGSTARPLTIRHRTTRDAAGVASPLLSNILLL